jgi:hypothetical protein
MPTPQREQANATCGCDGEDRTVPLTISLEPATIIAASLTTTAAGRFPEYARRRPLKFSRADMLPAARAGAKQHTPEFCRDRPTDHDIRSRAATKPMAAAPA